MASVKVTTWRLVPNGISLRLLIVSARAIDLVTLAFLVAASHDWASIRLWWHLCSRASAFSARMLAFRS